MSVCPNHDWDSYSYSTDSGPVIVGFHTEANKIDQSKYPYCARVIITIKAPNHNGGPAQDEAQILWDMEDRLVEALDAASVPCLLLGRLTHSGRRELVFQVADYTPFRPPVGRWIREHAAYETDVSEHDGWDFYFESVWPSETSWLLIMDRRVVDNLVKAGSDASKPHSLEFVFRGDQSALQEMQTALSSRGYTLLDFSPDESRLIMARSMTLDVGEIFRESVAHHELCGSLGVEYDGWGALTVS
ncbi:DUF695 domain-containing protein [Prosthecobacter sp.]|uniref:DUF695 domain-containing protein n=1 Tax=Prosthecobacter sp. TaxID=1965333 RepID=UPI002AB86BFA|nr:DUF695 domain-containing protein [Prosthecobacter sp.]MDZ4401968.1 DUF695 domain-containing protein [Prosthecobacter sp.]